MEQTNKVNGKVHGGFIFGALNDLPKAQLGDVYTTLDGEVKPIVKTTDIKAVVVGGKIVATVSNHYKLVQHVDAFAPIVEGIHTAGVENIYFSLMANGKWAKLNLMFCQAKDGLEGINYGFTARNSVDGRSAINYGFRLQKRTTDKVLRTERVIDVWAVRQVCSNGMKMRVPIEWHEISKLVDVTRLHTLFNESAKFAHVTDVAERVKQMGFIAEAFAMLQKPIEKMIEMGKDIYLTQTQAEAMIKAYIGKRLSGQIMAAYANEIGGSDKRPSNTLWALYNAVTYTASHAGLSQRTSLAMIEKAADMYEIGIRGVV